VITLDKKAFETKLNVLIGLLLSKELGLNAISESIFSRNRPDVTVFVNGVKIIIEGSYSKKDAESDVIKKLEKGLADLGIALHYKEDFPSNITDSKLECRLKASTFNVRLIIPEDISETLLAYFNNQRVQSRYTRYVTDWIEINGIMDIVPILNETIQFILQEKDVEKILGEIETTIKDFVCKTKYIDSNKQIAKNLYDIFYKLYGLSVGDYKEIDEFIYAKGALMLLLSEAFYQSIHTYIGLEDLINLTKCYGYRLGIIKAFEAILNIDYKPIYSTALQVICVLPDDLSSSLKNITYLAAKISSKRTLLRRDFAGKIYHKIVGDWSIRKGFATYFTTVSAAYLLAYLAVFTKTGVFNEFKTVKIGDLTCGSGTLLTASYNALRDLYIRSKFELGEEIKLECFHRQMLEECLWGLDALRYAVQIASTNLAFQNPTVKVNRMNTFSVPLGTENGRVVLGSLEFMKGRALPTISAYFAGQSAGYPFMEGAKHASITDVEEIPSEIPEFDFIIMNPPFTRATGRGGREKGGLFGFIVDGTLRKKVLDKYNDLRNSVQKQLKAIAQTYYSKDLGKLGIREEPFSIGQAGEGLLFLYLASKHVKNEGKIAFVLPKSLLTGISWFTARSLLLDKFHLEHVVVSYDAEKGYNFSESTSLSETLIVARKRKEANENEETTITILLNKPSTSLEGRALAFKILKENTNVNSYLKVNGAKAYTYKVPRRKLIERLHNWGSLLPFPDPKLTRICDEILSGNIFGANIPMVRLGEIATIGIDRHQFHNAFEKIEGRQSYSYPAVYGGKEEQRVCMLTKPNARILIKIIRTKKGETKKPGESLFNEFSSNLLIPDRIRVNTAHVIGIYCNEPVLSNIFYALRLKSNNVEDRLKALCLWFNTTWGILSILSNRSETEGGWISLKMTHWKLQQVLDVTKLNEDIIKNLVRVFNKYCKERIGRLPDQFNPEDIDSVRLSIDKEFANVLGMNVDEKEIKKLYELIYENLSKLIK